MRNFSAVRTPDALFIESQAWAEALGWRCVGDVFEDDRVQVWRDLDDRQNGRLDTPLGRLHVKRLKAGHGLDALAEAAGVDRLKLAGVPTVDVIASGVERHPTPHPTPHPGPRGFVAVLDFAGYVPADEWLWDGGDFGEIAGPTAKIAGRLHAAGLQHRDLYLNHFLLEPASGDLRLIDAARVRRRPWWRGRGSVVKDLAQFLYSTTHHGPITDDDRRRWLDAWRVASGLRVGGRPVMAKLRRIARHDAKLTARQPGRHVRLNEELGGGEG